MDNVVHFLARYKKLKPPHASTIKLVAQTIKDECGISIKEKDITLKRGGVVVTCHPTVRSELLRYVPKVLTTLFEKHNVRISYIR